MRIKLKIDHREIDLETGGSLYIEMTNWALFASFNMKANLWRPYWSTNGDAGKVIEFLGWRIDYSRIDRKFHGFTTAG
jgi:hypothetical protein